MKRRMIGLLTLASFIVFSFSCMTTRPIDPKLLTPNSMIIKVEKKSGEVVEFEKSKPASLVEGSIEGRGKLTKAYNLVEILAADFLKSEPNNNSNLFTVTMRDGQTVERVAKIEGRGEKAILYTIKAIPEESNGHFVISLAEVAKAWFRSFDAGLTFLAIAGPPLLILLAYLAAMGSQEKSLRHFFWPWI